MSKKVDYHFYDGQLFCSECQRTPKPPKCSIMATEKRKAFSSGRRWQNACCARHFDLLRNAPSTVSAYADECELLVFGAPLTYVCSNYGSMTSTLIFFVSAVPASMAMMPLP